MKMIEEHSLVDYQFSVIQKTSSDNETWNAKFSVLKEVIKHHLDAEEKSLFKQAKKVLDKEILKEKYDLFETNIKNLKSNKKKS